MNLRRRRTRELLGLLSIAVAACQADPRPLDPSPHQLPPVPAEGTASTLDLATWNIEWFGSSSNGPTNETLQLENVRDVILGADIDVWGIQEIVDAAHWERLESQLTGYAGFLANEPHVTDGAAYYSGFNDTEQKVGILYRSDLATLLGARIVLKENDHDFAGRPPLEVKLRVSLNGATRDVVVIVLHAKAGTGGKDWQRRKNASNALKAYLDATYPTQTVFVIGDWNDDVDTSISSGRVSPYQNFVDDAAGYTFPTRTLSDAGISSTVRYSDLIDHHLTTNEAKAGLVASETKVFRVDRHIADYARTTSDHYPVLTSYAFGSRGGSTNDRPSAAFTHPHTDLSCAFTDAIGRRGGGSYYGVCEAGTTTCSNHSTVTF